MAIITSNGTGGGNSNATVSWQGGVVPTEGTDVQILSGDTITLNATHIWGSDSATPALDVLSGGILVWDNASSITLTLKGDFKVRTGGTLTLDGTGDGTKILTIKLNYSASLVAGKYFWQWENGSSVTIQGYNKTRSWDTLSADASAGQKIVVTTNDNSAIWNVGDAFAIGSMSQKSTIGAENDTIASFVGTQLTKAGANYTYAHEENVAIVNLTRNIIVQPYSASYPGYIQSLITLEAGLDIDWVEFDDIRDVSSGVAKGISFPNSNIPKHLDYCVFNSVGMLYYWSGTSTGNIFFDHKTSYQVLTRNRTLSLISTVFIKDTYGQIGNGSASAGNITLSNSHICNMSAYYAMHTETYALLMSDCRVYGNYYFGLEIESYTELIRCFFDGNSHAITTTLFVLVKDISLGAQVANITSDIRITSAGMITAVNEAYLPVVATSGLLGSAYASVSSGSNHKNYKAYGILEKQSTTKYAGSNALKMSPNNATNALIASGTVFAINTETVAYSAYFRKDVAMAVLPYLKLSGAGITASTATMVNTQDNWQLLTVSGVATENGFCKVEFVCQNASGNVYVDDDQDSFNYWFEGDIPAVVPKPSLTATDMANLNIIDVSWSSGTFGDVIKKGSQLWQVILRFVIGK